jgi:hypothetical protein
VVRLSALRAGRALPQKYLLVHISDRAGGSVVVKALCYKPEGHRFESTISSKVIFLGSTVRPVRRPDNLVTICESIILQCRILNILQTYTPPCPVTGIAILYFTLLISIGD